MTRLKTGHVRNATKKTKVGGSKRAIKPATAGSAAERLEKMGKAPAIADRIVRAREVILGELRKSKSKSGACEYADVSTTQFYKWYREDAEFAAAVDEAVLVGREALEDEAVRRGKSGVRKAVYHQGEVVGYERQYSDRLLETMLKATNPEKFRENHSVAVEGKISHTVVNLSKDDLMELAAQRGLPTTIFEQ